MDACTLDVDFDEAEVRGGFLKRNGASIIVACLVLAGGAWAAVRISSQGEGGGRGAADNIVTVMLPPPKVIPPPPVQKPQDDPMLRDDTEDEPKPEEPSNEITTNIVGDGPPTAFRLAPAGGRGKSRIIARKNPVKEWSPYARAAAAKIADDMRRHSKLKHSSMEVVVRLWIDGTGRVTRAEADSTGDPAMDAALKNDVLRDKQLSGPPPAGMRMPVNLKITATRPK